MNQPATPQPKIFTFEEYLAYDDGTETKYELIDGELVAVPPEPLENCDIARYLLVEFLKVLPYTLLSYKEIEIEVSGRLAKTRLPDLMILGEECRSALQGKARGTITRDMPPPLVIVEVVSPGTANQARDYRYKRSEYAARGILEYWIVDPDRHQVTVLSLVEGLYEEKVYVEGDTVFCGVFPQIQIKVASIFQPA
ncbi:Uma2 family endonuclease [Leptodesmis sichuanensis]|uniref:Uma2 family endonuclease n=1 Tax=Leptodesmis sichuanensis TaxID=2906798 RepID=UPI001F25826C|nr:Uma2 family endonuclease [Leptodesmis sichuanensis]UIE38758.1 Uma2 family endonuclease [Leptodesmis sichuanensis A121]